MSISKSFLSIVFSTVSLFFIVAIITTVGVGAKVSSPSFYVSNEKISNDFFVYMLGMENVYFTQALPDDTEPFSISSSLFELTTSINLDDPRSLLGRELPGFALFDGKILIAGQGADYTNMPIESSPPMEVLMAEREAANERLEELDKLREEVAESEGELEEVVHIIHTHNRESFFPELRDVDETDPHQASHHSVNISLVGERLSLQLAKYGIGSFVNNTDIVAKLYERNWDYSQSYKLSRELIEKDIEKYGNFDFYFDLHRDGQKRKITTIDINGETYAKLLFVIGTKNPNYEQNQALAKKLHERIEREYPGLSRGVYDPSGEYVNGIYNQDLSENSILIEIGGVENSLEEVYRTVDVFAEIFSEFYWEQTGEGEE